MNKCLVEFLGTLFYILKRAFTEFVEVFRMTEVEHYEDEVKEKVAKIYSNDIVMFAYISWI